MIFEIKQWWWREWLEKFGAAAIQYSFSSMQSSKELRLSQAPLPHKEIAEDPSLINTENVRLELLRCRD